MCDRTAQIKIILDGLYERYSHKSFIPPDPLQFVYRYAEPCDMEITAFLSASLAYGRVKQIENSLTDLLGRMGPSPYDFVMSFGSKQRKLLRNFKHRFTTGDDISDLLTLLKAVLAEYGSIEKFFLIGYSSNDADIIPALSRFCGSLGGVNQSRGLKYLLVDPARGSACKRMNLFLRWMVRDSDVDTGLWKSIDKAKLIVPIDVHMARLCRILGFYDKKTVSLATAVKITRQFAKIDSADPVKYDFALSRIGIIENCTGRIADQCENCELRDFCLKLQEQ
ncbi:TIGR02757 family protein [Planctomycetota bacterium]